MSTQRPDLGFGAELESFDPQQWTTPNGRALNERPQREQVQQAASASGFQSREAAPEPPSRQIRRRRTGRNAQFNIKARPETIEAFCRIADANGWGLGETLEHAVALLEQQQSQK